MGAHADGTEAGRVPIIGRGRRWECGVRREGGERRSRVDRLARGSVRTEPQLQGCM